MITFKKKKNDISNFCEKKKCIFCGKKITNKNILKCLVEDCEEYYHYFCFFDNRLKFVKNYGDKNHKILWNFEYKFDSKFKKKKNLKNTSNLNKSISYNKPKNLENTSNSTQLFLYKQKKETENNSKKKRQN